MSRALLLGFILAVCLAAVSTQSDADKEAIKRTVLNYAEVLYEGNADRMESSFTGDEASERGPKLNEIA